MPGLDEIIADAVLILIGVFCAGFLGGVLVGRRTAPR
jgi:hypothetical protein